VISKEIPDSTADPYAYFLDNMSKSKYRKLLRERNLPEQGEPDRGHSFSLSKFSLHGSMIDITRVTKSFGFPEGTSWFNDQFLRPSGTPSGQHSWLTPAPLPNGGALLTFAQNAYAKVAPTSVVFDAAQFLGELREGLPRLVPDLLKSGANVFKKAGSDYLNVEFGWKPFINDLIKAGEALSNATHALKGTNQRVHRRYGTPPSYTIDAEINSGPISMGHGHRGISTRFPEFDDGSAVGGTALTGATVSHALRTTERSRWFEGEFTSFMKLGFDPSNYFDRLDALVNVKLTPDVLWELAPWSWLIDWGLQIGDTIKANELAANDRLVMHYGYAMETTRSRDLVSVDMSACLRSKPATSSYTYYPGLDKSATYVSETVYKRRLRANPYGFRIGGLQGLSASQVAILGALGLTKSGR